MKKKKQQHRTNEREKNTQQNETKETCISKLSSDKMIA